MVKMINKRSYVGMGSLQGIKNSLQTGISPTSHAHPMNPPPLQFFLLEKASREKKLIVSFLFGATEE